MQPRFHTLNARFGVLYASLIAIVVGVCVVFMIHLDQIRTDSGRVMEETREQGVLMRALSRIDTIQALLATPESLADSELVRARQLLVESITGLEGLNDHPDDPSSEQHQDAEAHLSDGVRENLAPVGPLLRDAADRQALSAAQGHLRAAQREADILRAIAQEEAQVANSDLERRASSMRTVMVATVIVAVLLLGLALSLVHFGVLRPLRLLRDGAERFGRGQLSHHIHVRNSDELGELARSLNGMADRLSDAQQHLEQRVRARTREFLRAARLADLGVLASGIAHEINTPLASIASCAEGLERRRKEGKLTEELLADYSATISSEVYRARGISTRMLSLVRQEPSALARVSLGLVLEQTVSALKHRAGQRRVNLEYHAPAPDVELNVNGGELVQIIVNLLANAIDASAPGQSVMLRAQVSGEHFTVTVRDQGSGIPEAQFDTIFEPFFTTKPPGEGTGLGLALVGTMVESHRGHVEVESTVGAGSLFRVTLPIDWTAST